MTDLRDAVLEIERILRRTGHADKGDQLVAALASASTAEGAVRLNRLVSAGMGSLWDVPISDDQAECDRLLDLLDSVYQQTKAMRA